MGYAGYSATKYSAAVDDLKAKGATFTRSATAARTGDYREIAESLDPRKLKDGVREACFAPGFNDCTAIAIGIDCTGSMSEVPKFIQKELPNLISTLTEQNISDHPNVMFVGFDDERYMPPDAVFQMSQFETGAPELLASINEMIIPGQGGGNRGEAYHLFFYALAKHTKIECFDRDGVKGYAFLICDEQPFYDAENPATHGTSPAVAKAAFGDAIPEEVSMLDILKEVVKRYNVFIIRPHHTSHGRDESISKMWRKLMEDAGEDPQHVMEVVDEASIIPTIAMCVGSAEGADKDEMASILKAKGAAGVDGAVAATKQLVVSSGGAVAVGTSSTDIATSDDAAMSCGRAR